MSTSVQLQAKTPLWRRLFWLIALWTASVLALTVVAKLFKLLMAAAGLGPR